MNLICGIVSAIHTKKMEINNNKNIISSYVNCNQPPKIIKSNKKQNISPLNRSTPLENFSLTIHQTIDGYRKQVDQPMAKVLETY